VRRRIPVTITVCAAFAAAGALGVGSVISSFAVSRGTWGYPFGVYRDTTYVYVVMSKGGLEPDNLYRYTLTGSFFGYKLLAGADTPSDADHSPLGGGYFAVHDTVQRDSNRRILHYELSTGSVVSSWVIGADMGSFAYVPGSTYMYVGGYGGYVYRFTTAGSLVGSFAAPYGTSALAATGFFKGRGGEYIITAAREYSKPAHVYTNTGSLVGSFKVPTSEYGTNTYGAVCAAGYPARYGTTYWCIRDKSLDYRMLYQLDLGANPAVAPASVGRIKVLFD
jgi:hypothetical protein